MGHVTIEVNKKKECGSTIRERKLPEAEGSGNRLSLLQNSFQCCSDAEENDRKLIRTTACEAWL